MKVNRKVIVDFFRKTFKCSKPEAEMAFNDLAVILMTKNITESNYTKSDLLFMVEKAYLGRSKNTYKEFNDWPPPLQRMFSPFYKDLKEHHKVIIQAKLGINCDRVFFIKDMWKVANCSKSYAPNLYHSAFKEIANKIRYSKELI